MLILSVKVVRYIFHCFNYWILLRAVSSTRQWMIALWKLAFNLWLFYVKVLRFLFILIILKILILRQVIFIVWKRFSRLFWFLISQVLFILIKIKFFILYFSLWFIVFLDSRYFRQTIIILRFFHAFVLPYLKHVWI